MDGNILKDLNLRTSMNFTSESQVEEYIKAIINNSDDRQMVVEICCQVYEQPVSKYIRQKLDYQEQSFVDDLTQMTLEKMTRYLMRNRPIEPIDHPKSYAIGIARNIVRDHFRGNKNGSSSVPITEEDIRDPEEDEITRLINSTALQDALKILSPLDQELVRLRYFEKWTYVKIGKQFNLWPALVSTRIKKSLVLLREELQKLDN